MTTPYDIVATYSEDDLTALLDGYLIDASSPVTDAEPGGVLRTLKEAFRDVLVDYLGAPAPDPTTRAQLVANAYPLIPAKPSGDSSSSLTLVADQTFNIQRNYDLTGALFASTFTRQTVRLFCDASHGPYTLTAGAFWVRSTKTGNRYVLIANATVPTNNFFDVTFQAEFSSDSQNGLSYNDAAGTLTDLSANPLPGLTASNVAPSFSPVTAVAVGLGVVTVGGSTPASATGYDLQITQDGQVGVALFQYRSNGGAWSATQTTAASYTIPSGPTITFTNDTGGSSPSFVDGDRYSFTSPGSPITQQGIDPETDPALLARCLARWTDLNAIPVEKHTAWAKAASPLVTRVRVDVTGPGRLAVTIAGAANPLAGGVVTAVQLYIDQRDGIAWISTVAAAAVQTVTPNDGIVTVPARKLSALQATAQAQWAAYLKSDEIGGEVLVAKLEQILMDNGATDVEELELNGHQDVVPIASGYVPAAGDIIANLTWVTI